MKQNNSYKILYLLDQLKTWHLIIAFVFMTLIFSYLYFSFSQSMPNDGLVKSDMLPVSFSDALYFSVVTETTLGYGDISPKGISRFLVCGQVLLGLVLAGVVVAKITSAPTKRLRSVTRKSTGNWIEIFHKESTYYIAKIKIYFDGDNLHLAGDNYNMEGKYEGSFIGNLISIEGNRLLFKYLNHDQTHLFNNGFTYLNFKDSGESKCWTEYKGTCHDHGKVERTSYDGYRAGPDEAQILTENSPLEERSCFIQNYLRSKGENIANCKNMVSKALRNS